MEEAATSLSENNRQEAHMNERWLHISRIGEQINSC